MQKRLLRIGVALAIVAAIAIPIMRMAQNKALVANESGQKIRTLIVAAPGMAPATFRDIAPGSTRTFRFFSRDEGGIALRATLADGTVLAGEDGYVTKYVRPCTMEFVIPATGRVLFDGHPASWPGQPSGKEQSGLDSFFTITPPSSTLQSSGDHPEDALSIQNPIAAPLHPSTIIANPTTTFRAPPSSPPPQQ